MGLSTTPISRILRHFADFRARRHCRLVLRGRMPASAFRRSATSRLSSAAFLGHCLLGLRGAEFSAIKIWHDEAKHHCRCYAAIAHRLDIAMPFSKSARLRDDAMREARDMRHIGGRAQEVTTLRRFSRATIFTPKASPILLSLTHASICYNISSHYFALYVYMLGDLCSQLSSLLAF